jgi:hypothetical protein
LPSITGKIAQSFSSCGHTREPWLTSEENYMRFSQLLCAATLVATAASADNTAVEQEFRKLAGDGCRNRDGDFIVRGMVSNATEDTVVLSDPSDSSSTLSLTLPGRGPFARVRGVFGKSREETVDQQLNGLRENRTPVVVTLKCKGNATPVARNISYRNQDGSRASISY